ncbi:MAG: oxidoreductase [Desulfovibrio sp.]|jgi:formate hydrogenlyase subunit 3/multisubunit Na+/H+ antiporter MnhD subunit|nr:oxidoreductase [Desulfovibrio sp.]
MPYLHDTFSLLPAVSGAILILAGFALAWRGRGGPAAALAGLTLADAGYLAAGAGFGGSAGVTGAVLLAAFNGAARLLSLLCLLRLQAHARGLHNGILTGIGREKPLASLLFSLGMFAALGVSPFLTPDAKPFILLAGIASQQALLPALLTLGNAAMAVFTLLAVHGIWMKGPYRPEDADMGLEARSLRLPLLLAVLLALMGIFGHSLAWLAASLVRAGGEVPPEFAPSWHPAVFLLYAGAFGVFILGRFSLRLRDLTAVLLPALALLLLFTDGALAPLARFFALISTGVGLLVALYSCGYIHAERSNAYFFFLLLMFGSLAGVAVADTLGGFFVFWEVMTLSSYVLVAWEDTDQAHAAAKKYFLMCSVAAAFMLPGLLLFQAWTGSLAVRELASASLALPPAAAALAALLVLVGCGVKAGLFPGHSWLPDAHPAAPSSISAPLSGVLTKAGIFGLFQIFLVVLGLGAVSGAQGTQGVSFAGWALTALGIMTMVYGELMALRQTDLKRLLAYSTMGQVGEICMTLGLCTWLAAAGALLHVLNHAVMKDLLFLCSGALILRAGTRNLADLRGLGKAMPFTATCMVIGLISILGLPPFAGFMSKFLMLYALAGENPLLAGLMLLASLAGCIYYTRIIRTLIFEPYQGPKLEEAPLSMRIPLATLAALCVVFGLFPQLALEQMVLPVLNGLAGARVMEAQAVPSLAVIWPSHSLLLLLGSLAPVLLRRNPRLAGQAAALILGLAAVLVLFDYGRLDTLSFLFALIITVIGCANMIYSVGYLDHSHTQWRFYAFFLCMAAGLTGVAVSVDIFSFFLFWEIMSSWSLYFVIVHDENEAALREGFKYFFFNVLGAAFLFLGVILLIQWSGGSGFDLVRAALPGLAGWQLALVMALMAVGFVMKAAQLPFRIDIQMHPATAPTPVSGYISSVLLKSAIFGLVKLFLLLGGGLYLSVAFSGFSLSHIMAAVVWIGGVTIVMAAVFAVFQTDIKLVLIYSTVSQLGYMVAGVALGTSLGVAGGLLHLINHVFFKDLLFLVAGAIIVRTHRQSMNELGGLGVKMPATLALFSIGAVCVIGLPPSNGFTSKWIIYHALMEQGYVAVAILSLVGSVLTLAYFAKMLHSAFLGQPGPELEKVTEAPRIMLLPMAFLAAGCALTSLFPGLVLAPLNSVLAELDLARLDVALWGINSGRGAWNATLTALLFAVAWITAARLLKRFNARERVTDIHSCGIPPADLNMRTNPGDLYSAPVSLWKRWRGKQSASEA